MEKPVKHQNATEELEGTVRLVIKHLSPLLKKKKENLKPKQMPYKSKKQEAYFNANRKKLESQGVNVDEWNKASKGKKLPVRVKKKK